MMQKPTDEQIFIGRQTLQRMFFYVIVHVRGCRCIKKIVLAQHGLTETFTLTVHPNRTALYNLHKMRMHYFCSGLFTPGLNAVLGPTGSGKTS